MSSKAGFNLYQPLCGFLLAAGAVLLGMQFMLHHSADNHAQMVIARRMLAGERFGRDIFEINLPTVFYLHYPAILLSQWTGIALEKVFYAGAAAMGVLCLWLAFLILRRGRRPYPLLTVSACFFAIMAAAMCTRAFGDRDYYLFLFTLPYVFLMAYPGGDMPRGLRTGAAMLAGLGFALKPHYAAVWLILSLYFLWERRSFRRSFLAFENVVVVGSAFAVLAVLLLLDPDYFTTLLPLAVRTYGNVTGMQFGWLSNLVLYCGLFLITGAVLAKGEAREGTRTGPWLALCGGYLVSALINGPWGYTLCGFMASFLLLATLLFAGRKRDGFYTAAACGCYGLLLLFVLSDAWTAFDRAYSDKPYGDALALKDYPQSRAKLEHYLGRYPHYVSYGYWLWCGDLAPLESDRVCEGHYPTHLWSVWRYLEEDRRGELDFAQLPADRKVFFDALAEDISKPETQLLIVDVSEQFWPEGEEKLPPLLGFFSHYEPFRGAMKNYALAERWSECTHRDSACAFEVYVRKKR